MYLLTGKGRSLKLFHPKTGVVMGMYQRVSMGREDSYLEYSPEYYVAFGKNGEWLTTGTLAECEAFIYSASGLVMAANVDRRPTDE